MDKNDPTGNASDYGVNYQQKHRQLRNVRL